MFWQRRQLDKSRDKDSGTALPNISQEFLQWLGSEESSFWKALSVCCQVCLYRVGKAVAGIPQFEVSSSNRWGWFAHWKFPPKGGVWSRYLPVLRRKSEQSLLVVLAASLWLKYPLIDYHQSSQWEIDRWFRLRWNMKMTEVKRLFIEAFRHQDRWFLDALRIGSSFNEFDFASLLHGLQGQARD